MRAVFRPGEVQHVRDGGVRIYRRIHNAASSVDGNAFCIELDDPVDGNAVLVIDRAEAAQLVNQLMPRLQTQPTVIKMTGI